MEVKRTKKRDGRREDKDMWTRQGAVWPDAGIKINTKFSSTGPNSNQSSFLLYSDILQNSPKSFQIFGPRWWENLLQRTIENRPI